MSNKASILTFLKAEHPDAFWQSVPSAEQRTPSELPPALLERTRDVRRDGVAVHAIDALVPLRAFDPHKTRVRSHNGAEYHMTGRDLVQSFKERVQAASRRTRAHHTVLAFDKSAYVPMTKGVEQAKRRAPPKAGSAAALDDETPLREVPDDASDELYLTLDTELRELGVWREVMDDRLDAQTDAERAEYKVLSNGARYRRHQGRRQNVIAFVCYHLVRPERDDMIGEDAMDDLTLELDSERSVIMDGHCLTPEMFHAEGDEKAWIKGFFPPSPAQLNDDTIDWCTVPLVVWQDKRQEWLSMRFSCEHQNTIGEADLTMFSHAPRRGGATTTVAPVIFDSIDTDITLLALLFQEKTESDCYVRIAQRAPRGNVPTDDDDDANHAYAKYVDVRLLRERLIAQFSDKYDRPIEVLVAAMLSRGCDYMPAFAYVSHQRFWEALCLQSAWIGRDLVTATDREVDPDAWLRLVLAAYSHANGARLLNKTDGSLHFDSVREARLALLGQGRSSNGKMMKALKADRAIPDDDVLVARFGALAYVYSMYLQVGEQYAYDLPTGDQLELYGYRRLRDAEPWSRLNIAFAASPKEA